MDQFTRTYIEAHGKEIQQVESRGSRHFGDLPSTQLPIRCSITTHVKRTADNGCRKCPGMLCVRNWSPCTLKICGFVRNWSNPVSLEAVTFHEWKPCISGMRSASKPSSTNTAGRTRQQWARTAQKQRV